MSPVQVIILAAGQGTRLKPLTLSLPKCLVEVGGQSFLKRNLDHLARTPGLNICMVTGFQEQKIRIFLQQGAGTSHIHLCTNPLYAVTNNAYSLWIALKEHPGPFLLLDGDLLYEGRLLDRLLEDPREDLLVVDTDTGRLNEEAMKVSCNADRQTLTAISKAIPIPDACGESIGMGKFSGAWARLLLRSLTEKMRETHHHASYYEDVIAPLLPSAPPLKILPTDGLAWDEVDTPEDLARANSLWLNH